MYDLSFTEKTMSHIMITILLTFRSFKTMRAGTVLFRWPTVNCKLNPICNFIYHTFI